MADTQTHTQNKQNDTIRAEQAKAEVSGSQKAVDQNSKGSPAQGKMQDERDRLDQQRHQQTGVGGNQPASKTGEPGRARSELDEKSKSPEKQPG